MAEAKKDGGIQIEDITDQGQVVNATPAREPSCDDFVQWLKHRDQQSQPDKKRKTGAVDIAVEEPDGALVFYKNCVIQNNVLASLVEALEATYLAVHRNQFEDLTVARTKARSCLVVLRMLDDTVELTEYGQAVLSILNNNDAYKTVLQFVESTGSIPADHFAKTMDLLKQLYGVSRLSRGYEPAQWYDMVVQQPEDH
jgi:hypothetical protein